jgi:D-glutamate cyclase
MTNEMANSSHAELIAEFDRMIRRDPGHRGLIRSESYGHPLCLGHLLQAAKSLSESADSVVIVTGFFVPPGQPPSAETDGPPGALLLASALQSLGAEVFVVTDNNCHKAVESVADYMGFSSERVVDCPKCTSQWTRELLTERLQRPLTHLIAVERVGPSHTVESLLSQERSGDVPMSDFTARVSVESYNHCHNMRGTVIDQYSADLHRLFELLPQYNAQATTIGIGDGGNEIGMGVIPWEELDRRLPGESSGRVPCRIATDWNIVAGTSNWGAYALTAATLLLSQRLEFLRDWGMKHQERLLESMIKNGPAVDGVTGLQEPTVDGLPFLTYIQPWMGMRRLLGLE